MSELFRDRAGATPLDPEDQDGLIPTWIATHADLNRAEQLNIALAQAWVFGRGWSLGDIDGAWLLALHRRMFADVWQWAGSFRQRDTNLGVPWYEVRTAVEGLTLDLAVQVGDATWPADEIAVRCHHRLVSIHPFPNGNGRHSRLAADVIVTILGGERFSWGERVDLTDQGPARARYLAALRAADRSDYAELLTFARA